MQTVRQSKTGITLYIVLQWPRGGCPVMCRYCRPPPLSSVGNPRLRTRAVIWLEGMILKLNVTLTFVNRITSSAASAAFGTARLADVLFAVSLAAASSERWLLYSFASLFCLSASSQVLTHSSSSISFFVFKLINSCLNIYVKKLIFCIHIMAT